MSGRGSELPALFIPPASWGVSREPGFDPFRGLLTLCIICMYSRKHKTYNSGIHFRFLCPHSPVCV